MTSPETDSPRTLEPWEEYRLAQPLFARLRKESWSLAPSIRFGPVWLAWYLAATVAVIAIGTLAVRAGLSAGGVGVSTEFHATVFAALITIASIVPAALALVVERLQSSRLHRGRVVWSGPLVWTAIVIGALWLLTTLLSLLLIASGTEAWPKEFSFSASLVVLVGALAVTLLLPLPFVLIILRSRAADSSLLATAIALRGNTPTADEPTSSQVDFTDEDASVDGSIGIGGSVDDASTIPKDLRDIAAREANSHDRRAVQQRMGGLALIARFGGETRLAKDAIDELGFLGQELVRDRDHAIDALVLIREAARPSPGLAPDALKEVTGIWVEAIERDGSARVLEAASAVFVSLVPQEAGRALPDSSIERHLSELVQAAEMRPAATSLLQPFMDIAVVRPSLAIPDTFFQQISTGDAGWLLKLARAGDFLRSSEKGRIAFAELATRTARGNPAVATPAEPALAWIVTNRQVTPDSPGDARITPAVEEDIQLAVTLARLPLRIKDPITVEDSDRRGAIMATLLNWSLKADDGEVATRVIRAALPLGDRDEDASPNPTRDKEAQDWETPGRAVPSMLNTLSDRTPTAVERYLDAPDADVAEIGRLEAFARAAIQWGVLGWAQLAADDVRRRGRSMDIVGNFVRVERTDARGREAARNRRQMASRLVAGHLRYRTKGVKMRLAAFAEVTTDDEQQELSFEKAVMQEVVPLAISALEPILIGDTEYALTWLGWIARMAADSGDDFPEVGATLPLETRINCLLSLYRLAWNEGLRGDPNTVIELPQVSKEIDGVVRQVPDSMAALRITYGEAWLAMPRLAWSLMNAPQERDSKGVIVGAERAVKAMEVNRRQLVAEGALILLPAAFDVGRLSVDGETRLRRLEATRTLSMARMVRSGKLIRPLKIGGDAARPVVVNRRQWGYAAAILEDAMIVDGHGSLTIKDRPIEAKGMLAAVPIWLIGALDFIDQPSEDELRIARWIIDEAVDNRDLRLELLRMYSGTTGDLRAQARRALLLLEVRESDEDPTLASAVLSSPDPIALPFHAVRNAILVGSARPQWAQQLAEALLLRPPYEREDAASALFEFFTSEELAPRLREDRELRRRLTVLALALDPRHAYRRTPEGVNRSLKGGARKVAQGLDDLLEQGLLERPAPGSREERDVRELRVRLSRASEAWRKSVKQESAE